MEAEGAFNQYEAKSMEDLVTTNQLIAIRAIANSKGLNATKESERVFKLRPEELSRKGASRFIDYLKTGSMPIDKTARAR
jgi:hypothetical protein